MVASNNIGTLGSTTGEPVEIFWNPLLRFSGFQPWILAGLLLLLKKNRANQSWLCFVPSTIASILISILISLEVDTTAAHEISKILIRLPLGLCIAWLLAPYLARRSRLANFFLLILILLPVSLIQSKSADDLNDLEKSLMTADYIILSIYIAFNISMSFSLASILSKNNYSASRFAISLFALNLLFFQLSAILFPIVTNMWSVNIIGVWLIALLAVLAQMPLLLISLRNSNIGLRMEAWQGRLPAESPAGVQDATECRSSIQPLQ